MLFALLKYCKRTRKTEKKQELTISFQNAVFKIENTNFHLLLLRQAVSNLLLSPK